MVYCQNCGKDTAGAGVTFYGNVLCGEACKKSLSERLYFRDTPPEPGSTWFCPHCGAQNPLGDPRKQLRPNCTQCGKPLDPASAAPPKKQGCLGLLLLLALPVGAAGLATLAACESKPTLRPRSTSTAPVVSLAPADGAGTAAAARQKIQQTQREQQALARPAAQAAAQSAGEPKAEASGETGGDDPSLAVSVRRMQHHRRLAQAASGAADRVGAVVAVGPKDPKAAVGDTLHGAKFEPPLGRVLHGMGQWPDGNESYLRALDDPGLQPASQLSFLPIGDWPRTWQSRINNWREGMSGSVAQGYIPHLDISLYGLDAANVQQSVDAAIATSDRYDGRLRDLARAVRSLEGPVFVRIGGEFSGQWNPYTPFVYPVAFRKIVELFRAEGADNAAFVWCYEPSSAGDFAEVDPERGARWYPGDDVVDWFSVDVFDVADFSGPLERDGAATSAGRCEAFLRMALEHDKPVIVAEASAAFVQITPDPADGEADWEAWFAPFFRFLEANPNIEAFHYINVDWSKAGEFGEQGWKDARIDVNPLIVERFREELRKPRYLHAGHKEQLNGASALPPPVPAPALEPPRADEPTPRRG